MLLAGLSLSSGTELLTSPGGGTPTTSANDLVLGYQFTVRDTPIQVTKLGIWDARQDGIADVHQVGLWDAGRNLLGSVTIPVDTGGPSYGTFYYVNLSAPVNLEANATYTIGATYSANDADKYLWADNASANATLSSDLSGSTAALVELSDLLVFPSAPLSADGTSAIGPNAVYALVPIPEPAVGALVLLGGGILVVRRVRRQPHRVR